MKVGLKMSNFRYKYFLATNSSEGFVSVFKNRYNAADGWKCYIIKGGPGTGKSSFMKYIAAKADDKKLEIELCPCSSDPDSLDALVIPQKKIIIMDGTAPHTVDPEFPAICEEILNFGSFWNTEMLKSQKDNIINLTQKNKALHKSASRYILAAGEILKDSLKIAKGCCDNQKILNFSKKLCKKYIPKKNSKGVEETRFLYAITPKGVVSFANTALKNCKTHIIIEDKYSAVSNEIMQNIKNYAILNGHKIITIKNSFLPSDLIDHIIIPELSLCFVREFDYQHFESEARRIHSRRFMNTALLSKNRKRLKFNSKLMRELLLSATTTLKEAKSVHDELENYYIGAMDFEALTFFAKDFCDNLLK